MWLRSPGQPHDRRSRPTGAGSEPRQQLSLVVDLEPAQDCEERFDLQLYRDRGVDLVRWDDAVGRCMGRSITVVYLPQRLSRQQLLDKINKLAKRVSK